MKAAGMVAAISLALVAVGCSSGGGKRAEAASGTQCPASWRPGWQRLADHIQAPVYCPSWMPNPLDAQIGGQWTDIRSVSRDRSYLISFLWQELGSGEVHVNLRGYPGRTRVPRCNDLDTNRLVPCFSDSQGIRRIGGFAATVYSANQGADQWHVLYAWRFNGSLYAVSEHVTPPYTYRRVLRNLNRIMRGLVLIEPQA